MPLEVVTPEIRRYLLGDLDAASAAALEDRYVNDPALLEDVRAAEDALIEAFLEGDLRPAERERFEAHYLASPVHRDRVAIARALRRRATGPAQSSTAGASFYGWMAMAAALVLASLWIVSRGGSPPPQQAAVPETPRSQPQTPEPAPAPAPAPPPGPAPSAARAILALTLSPITTRGGDQATTCGRRAPSIWCCGSKAHRRRPTAPTTPSCRPSTGASSGAAAAGPPRRGAACSPRCACPLTPCRPTTTSS